jgi:hypothetical protein
LIFRAELAQKVKRGMKTQTRRPIKPGETACRYEEGKNYAVQPGRGRKAICRIEILSVDREPLLESLDDDVARAEGFQNFGEFIDYWQGLYGKRTDLEVDVWAIRFELWRPHERTVREPVRLLALQNGRRNAGQYTQLKNAALPGEPEAIDPAVIESLSSTQESMQRWVMNRVEAESRISLSYRLDRVLEEARSHDVDVRWQVASIRKRIEALESKVRKRAA